jgi:hypothetical protein
MPWSIFYRTVWTFVYTYIYNASYSCAEEAAVLAVSFEPIPSEYLKEKFRRKSPPPADRKFARLSEPRTRGG